MRESVSLKAKFDKLANVKKPTENPSCSANVLSAKNIARNILARSCIFMAGEDDDSDTLSDDNIIDEASRKHKRSGVDVSPNKRPFHAKGVNKNKEAEE